MEIDGYSLPLCFSNLVLKKKLFWINKKILNPQITIVILQNNTTSQWRIYGGGPGVWTPPEEKIPIHITAVYS